MNGAAALRADAPPPSLLRPARLRAEVGDATGRGVRVAVIDSGVDPAWCHSGLAEGVGLLAREPAGDEVGPASEFRLESTCDVADLDGHGTSCIDLLLGIAPGVTVHPVRVFHRRRRTSIEVLVAALAWAVEQRVDVVNLSLGTIEVTALRPLYRVCEAARAAGTVVVAAHQRHPRWESLPAAFPNALGVAGGEFANVHDYLYHPRQPIDCVAQGRRRVRLLGGGRAEAFAASYAAPHVSALVALFLERRRRDGEERPGLDAVRRSLARCALPAPGAPGCLQPTETE